MKRRVNLICLIVVLLVSATGLMGQVEGDLSEKKTRREKRIEVRQAKEERKIRFNSKELALLMSQRDLVIKDDGVGRGLQIQSGITNFFRVKGDTLTFQKIRAEIEGTALISDRDAFKIKGLIIDVKVMENIEGQPSRVQVTYTDIMTLAPHRAQIIVHANRLEVKNDDGSDVFIRGKLTTNEDANVLEIGQNSSDALLNRTGWKSGRKPSGGIDLRYYRGN